MSFDHGKRVFISVTNVHTWRRGKANPNPINERGKTTRLQTTVSPQKHPRWSTQLYAQRVTEVVEWPMKKNKVSVCFRKLQKCFCFSAFHPTYSYKHFWFQTKSDNTCYKLWLFEHNPTLTILCPMNLTCNVHRSLIKAQALAPSPVSRSLSNPQSILGISPPVHYQNVCMNVTNGCQARRITVPLSFQTMFAFTPSLRMMTLLWDICLVGSGVLMKGFDTTCSLQSLQLLDTENKSSRHPTPLTFWPLAPWLWQNLRGESCLLQRHFTTSAVTNPVC